MRLENLGVVLLLLAGALPNHLEGPQAERALAPTALPPCEEKDPSAPPNPDDAPGAYCIPSCKKPVTQGCSTTVRVNNGSKLPDGRAAVCTQTPPETEWLHAGTTTPIVLSCPEIPDEACETSVKVIDPPVITLVGDSRKQVECGSQYIDQGADAHNCTGALGVTTSSTVNTALPGIYTITYQAKDPYEEQDASLSRIVEVRDTTPPALQCPPSIEVQAEEDGKATVTPVQTWASDTCKLDTVSGPDDNRLPVGGPWLVTFTARDAAGNTATCVVAVTVRPLRDRAMLGAGCSAASWDALLPVGGLALVLLSRRRMSPRARRLGRMSPRTWGGWLILGMLAMSRPASAQPMGIPSFELERLWLNPSGMGSWVLGTGELLPAGGYRLALVGHYENKPLSLYEDGALLGVIVRHRVTTVLSGAVGLGGRVELGAQVPLLLFQQGDDLTARGVGMPEGGVALGTPLITARFSVLAEHQEDPVDLSIGLSASPGLGSAAALARELHAIPNVMLGRRFGQVRTSLDAGLMLRPRTLLTDKVNVQDEVGHALRLGAGLASIGEGLGGEVAAIGSVPLRREGFSLELLSGVRLPVGERLELQGMAGLGLGNAPGIPRFRLLFGMAFGKVSRPARPAPEEAPESPEFQDKDWDRDGVLNWVDACPEEPGPPARRGCPVLDTDGDGVVDEKDQCPRKRGIVEMAGCPRKDTDKDTVWDHEDNCREIPGPPENQGCPTNVRQLVVIQRRRIAIKDTIHFDYDKATIKSVSFPLLNQVAQVLNEHPEIVSVSIEGHTDDTGSDAYNRDLALRRAGAVRDYLEGKGVARSRMSVRGFGEDRPLTTNATEEGRAINRRVEFITRYESDAP